MITVEINDSGLRAVLSRLQAVGGNVQPALKKVGAALVQNINLAFKDESDPWGSDWQPLSAVTQARRRQGKGSGQNKILQDTGRLRNSIHAVATADSVTVATANVRYAATHQFGAKKGQFGRTKRGAAIPWGDIPSRPFFPIRNGRAELPDDWQREAVALIAQYIAKAAT